MAGEARGGLVHDEHTRVHGQRLGDLYELLVADGQRADERRRMGIEPHRLEKLARLAVLLRLVDQPQAPLLAAQKNVRRHVEIVREVQLLVNERGARRGRCCG